MVLTPATTTKAAGPSEAAGLLGGKQIRGMILGGSQGDPVASIADFPRLKSMGVNMVSVYIFVPMTTPYSNSLNFRRAAPGDNQLRLIAGMAHLHGLAVQFMPMPRVTDRVIWRGKIQPSNVDAFFSSYSAMVQHYVKLANQMRVEMLAIGSELTSLQGYTAKWRSLGAWTNNHYRGVTTYMATAPMVFEIPWWDAVDMISVSPYYSLSRAAIPSVSDMVRSWRQSYLPPLANLSKRFHRPILFDEIGYASVEYTAHKPAVSFREGHPPSELAQANAYRALLQAMAGQSWLRGVFWWHWGDPRARGFRTSYLMRDKQAECVLTNYWSNNRCLSASRP